MVFQNVWKFGNQEKKIVTENNYKTPVPQSPLIMNTTATSTHIKIHLLNCSALPKTLNERFYLQHKFNSKIFCVKLILLELNCNVNKLNFCVFIAFFHTFGIVLNNTTMECLFVSFFLTHFYLDLTS